MKTIRATQWIGVMCALGVILFTSTTPLAPRASNDNHHQRYENPASLLGAAAHGCDPGMAGNACSASHGYRPAPIRLVHPDGYRHARPSSENQAPLNPRYSF